MNQFCSKECKNKGGRCYLCIHYCPYLDEFRRTLKKGFCIAYDKETKQDKGKRCPLFSCFQLYEEC